jgi:hypothetical protein
VTRAPWPSLPCGRAQPRWLGRRDS